MKVQSCWAWVLGLAGLAWGACAWLDVGGQRKAFYVEGREELYDFWMPMDCVRGGYVRDDGIQWSGWILPEELARGVTETAQWRPGAVFRTGWVDRVYPAFALLPFKAIPLTRAGGWGWSIGAGMLFLLALVVCAQGRLWPLVLACSFPFIFNLERGNPVWLSAAAVAVFLAWWDDETRWKRIVAAVCLAVASAMKLAPAGLGLVYLREGFLPVGRRHWRLAIFAGVLTVVLLTVPWIWMPDGFAGVSAFWANAKHHSVFVLRAADFGLVQLWRSVRLVLGCSVSEPWPGMMVVARLSQLLGLGALVLGAKRRDYLLLVGGMLLAAGNMYYYAALYLLPVLVWESRAWSAGQAVKPGVWGSAVLWFALCCPLQLVVLGHSANLVLGNLAFMTMMISRVFLCYNNRHEAAE